MADEPNRTRRIDEALLRYLARTFGRRREVAKTSLFPPNRRESLVVDLDADYYPEPVEAVRLEIRVYANGEFHVSCFETVRGERRRCRWIDTNRITTAGITSIRCRLPARSEWRIGTSPRTSRRSSGGTFYRGSNGASANSGTSNPGSASRCVRRNGTTRSVALNDTG